MTIDHEAIKLRAVDAMGFAKGSAGGGGGARAMAARDRARYFAERERRSVPIQQWGAQDPLRRWWERAACRDKPQAIFFPIDTRRSKHGPVGPLFDGAKAICATCEVRDNCLDDALAHHEADGCFGGMTPEERRAEARRRGRT